MALDNFQNDKALIIVYDGVEIKQYAKSKLSVVFPINVCLNQRRLNVISKLGFQLSTLTKSFLHLPRLLSNALIQPLIVFI